MDKARRDRCSSGSAADRSKGRRETEEKEKGPSKDGPGGDDGDRTHYLLNAIQALSQVSYTPTARVIIAHFIGLSTILEQKSQCVGGVVQVEIGQFLW